MTINLGQHIVHAHALAKAGDYVTSGMILQLVELIVEKDAAIAKLLPSPVDPWPKENPPEPETKGIA